MKIRKTKYYTVIIVNNTVKIVGERGSGKTTLLLKKFIKTPNSIFVCEFYPHVKKLIHNIINEGYQDQKSKHLLREKLSMVISDINQISKIKGIRNFTIFVDDAVLMIGDWNQYISNCHYKKLYYIVTSRKT